MTTDVPAVRGEVGATSRASIPLPNGPFDGVRTTLESRAAAGDAEAAYQLGHVMFQCARYEPISDQAFAGMIAKVVVGMGRFVRVVKSEPLDSADSLDTILHAKAEQDRLCTGTEALRRTLRPGDAHRWNHMAAMKGHPRAMAEYGLHAFVEYETDADLLDHAEEVARRRDTARVMLERARMAGEREALLQGARAYSNGGWLRRDPVRALGYWMAYRSGPVQPGTPEGALRLGDAHYGAGVDAAGRAQAIALARSLGAGALK